MLSDCACDMASSGSGWEMPTYSVGCRSSTCAQEASPPSTPYADLCSRLLPVPFLTSVPRVFQRVVGKRGRPVAAGAAVALVSRHHRGPAIVAHLVAVVWGGAVTIIIRGDATEAVVAAGAC